MPDLANICWSVNFMSDTLYSDQPSRTLNVVNDFNQEGLDIEVNTTLPAPRIIRVLDRIAATTLRSLAWTMARNWSVWHWLIGARITMYK